MFWKRRKPAEELIRAAAGNDRVRVDELLALGVDPNVRDATGLTPLMSAAFMGHDGILRTLIARDAVLDGQDERGYTALMFACNAGKLLSVKFLLRAGADVNARDNDGSTPLMFAAQHGQDQVVRVLLGSGADPERVGNHGLSAIGFAEQNKLVSTLEILRNRQRGGTPFPERPVTAELRSRSLTTPAEELGIVPPARGAGAWGVIMDATFEGGGSYTAVALADGNASIYIGEQSGVIGGFAHEPVRKAAKVAVALAEAVASSFSPGVPQAMPAPGCVRLYLRSRAGLLVSPELEEKQLGETRHGLSKLFSGMHEVIGQLRMVDESRDPGV